MAASSDILTAGLVVNSNGDGGCKGKAFGLEGWELLLLCGEGESDGGCKGKAFGLEGWELLLLWGRGEVIGGFAGLARTRAKASSCATLNLSAWRK